MMQNRFNPIEYDRQDTERIRHYRQLLDFYNGVHWEGKAIRGEKRLTINYARVFIDKGVSYLMSGIHFNVEPTDDTEQSKEQAVRAEAALNRIYEDNNLEQLDFETEVDCSILGDACYKVIWDSVKKKLTVTAPDIQGIHVKRDDDNATVIRQVTSRYNLSAEAAVRLYNYKATGNNVNITERWTDTEFELWMDGLLKEKKPNPYGFIPFVIFPNLREPKHLWGVSDLIQIMEPQRELNRAISQISRILELSGNPIAVFQGTKGTTDIAVKPGTIWNIPEDAKAYLIDLLQGGGARLHIDYINLLYRILHDLSESPRAAFGGTERDLSGVALEMELQPLLQKIRRKRIIRTAAYNRRNQMILDLLQKYTGEDFGNHRLKVVWGPVLPQDFSKLVADEQTLVQSGIHSRRRAMNDLGIDDPEMEFSRWLEERKAILVMNREFNGGNPRERARDSGHRAENIEI
jgi:hypothetical protein